MQVHYRIPQNVFSERTFIIMEISQYKVKSFDRDDHSVQS